MFNLYLLNQKLERIMLIENYQSVIWTERYSEAGDFEIQTTDIYAWKPYVQSFAERCLYPASDSYENVLTEPWFVQKSTTNTLMIIEDFKLTTDIVDGPVLTITGRSLISLLDRRQIFPACTSYTDSTNPYMTPWNYVKKLFNWAVGKAPNPYAGWYSRGFPITLRETPDTRITNGSECGFSYVGVSLYDALKEICENNCWGMEAFAIPRENPTVEAPMDIIVNIYMGNDVSDLVIFSPKVDNFANSELFLSSRNVYNRTCYTRPSLNANGANETQGGYQGLASGILFGSRERTLNVSDMDLEELKRQYPGPPWENLNMAIGNIVSDEVYLDLTNYGMYGQADFSGSAETSVSTFILGKDYSLGDVVMVENEYKISGKTQIVEIIESFDSSNGYQVYPTFSGFSVYNGIMR